MAKKTIPQRELRNEKNAKLINAVAAGETFVVTRHGGEPVAELRPIQSARKTFITRDDLARVAGAGGVRIDPDQFRRDLDATIDQSL